MMYGRNGNALKIEILVDRTCVYWNKDRENDTTSKFSRGRGQVGGEEGGKKNKRQSLEKN